MDNHALPPAGFFVLHAGATNLWETNLDRQLAVQDVLFDVPSTARASLRAGASVLDVVESTVVALEECPLFNARQGIGSHRVWRSRGSNLEQLWLTEMHHQSVPFYQAYLDGYPAKASCADFLVGLGELMGCGVRHETADQVLDSLSRRRVDASQYSWYVDIRRLKPMKAVGWGVGIERYL